MGINGRFAALLDGDGIEVRELEPESCEWTRDANDAAFAAACGAVGPATVPVTLDEGARMPTRAHPGEDAGLDLYSRETKVVPPHGSAEFATGVHMRLPHGYCGMIMSKSGLNRYHGIVCTGLNDEGFTGEIVAVLHNLSDEAYTVRKGDKVTQVAIVPCIYPEPVLVDRLPSGSRGDSGYGSTGR